MTAIRIGLAFSFGLLQLLGLPDIAGPASWYGPCCIDNMTANGEAFTAKGFTAAVPVSMKDALLNKHLWV